MLLMTPQRQMQKFIIIYGEREPHNIPNFGKIGLKTFSLRSGIQEKTYIYKYYSYNILIST